MVPCHSLSTKLQDSQPSARSDKAHSALHLRNCLSRFSSRLLGDMRCVLQYLLPLFSLSYLANTSYSLYILRGRAALILLLSVQTYGQQQPKSRIPDKTEWCTHQEAAIPQTLSEPVLLFHFSWQKVACLWSLPA